MLRAIVLAMLSVGTVVPAAGAQETQALVQGRVVERGTGRGIAGTSVDLVGFAHVLTGEDGRFRLRVTPGRHTLAVEALGYGTREIPLLVRADTTLLIELDIAPVRLDTVTVRTRTIAVRGRVVERQTGLGALHVEIWAGADRRTETNTAGGYRVGRVPVGEIVIVRARGLGYLPADVAIVAERDTTIDFELDPDPVGQRMMAAQVERLEARSRTIPHRYEINRRTLLAKPAWTIHDVLNEVLGSRRMQRVRCVLVDDVQRPDGLRELRDYLPVEVERIEILERDTMIRVYTRRFIHRMVQRRVSLGPILIIDGGPGSMICR